MSVPNLHPDFTARFHHFGENSNIQDGGQIYCPEGVYIGKNVSIRAHYYFNIVTEDIETYPKIIIGDGCTSNPGFIISATNYVELGPHVEIDSNVFISDTGHHFRPVDNLALSQGIGANRNRVYIGEGTSIGEGAVIIGNLRIGKGSIVRPHSFVECDIPDYCIVAGTPARIMQVYDPESGNWIDVKNEEEANKRISIRRLQPLMSICLPTYNRAANLDHCLHAILTQVGNNELVEVIVSDNASTDATPQVVAKYREQYRNLMYFRNEENIGADRNIFQVMFKGAGKFIKLQGDDDYQIEGTLLPLLNVLQKHGDCGVVHVNVHNNDGQVYLNEGLPHFLAATSIMSTFITGTILRREDLLRVDTPEHFLDSSFNQMYIQYAILQHNPRFCIINRSMYRFAANDPSGYNFGNVVFRSYQSILNYFLGNGLSEQDIRIDKHLVLYNKIIPWFHDIIQNRKKTNTDGFEDIFSQFYKDEPYFEQALQWIRSIRASVSAS
ncbi:glycosyltransferase [Paenibacillus plantarum]|nr:glycosyltransferase [Paenibacillus plantarum]